MQYLNNAFMQFFDFILRGVSSVISDKNYSFGFAIILMTAVIRIILLPLNIKQTKSSVAMSEIQPEVKKIQDKYKNDPKKSQEEIMKLYKEKGASPLNGCLPLLIQWPVFIALYYAFNNIKGIEGVRFLWINNLASSDMILAVLAGVTTYFSGKLMQPSTDSAQAKQTSTMNIGMSIFMTVMSWKLKSALVLYWVINNSIQIAQTFIMRKMDKNKAKEI